MSVQKTAALSVESDSLLRAIKACMIEQKGIRPTARAYNVPKSNLDRYVKQLREKYKDGIANVTDTELSAAIRRLTVRVPTNMVRNKM